MDDKNMTRETIHIISKHSNWKAASIEKQFLDSGVYADKKSWLQFFNYFLIGLGISFTLAGIVFFFAYNWADMHKFLKLGLIETLIVVCIAVVLLRKPNEKTTNILLSIASVLVGLLFAVFGQIYQTGADAYDFFLGWTIFIALWTLVSNFPPLWLIFIFLLNTTIVLYSEQVANDAIGVQTINNTLFIVNAFFVILLEILLIKKIIKEKTKWFMNTVALAAIVPITISIIYGIFEVRDGHLLPLMISIVLAVAFFATGFLYGLKTKNLFYVSAIPFSIIFIISALIIEPVDDPFGVFFIVSFFIIACTTFLIRQIIKLKNQWHGI